jgi:methylenetetrahydrofolate dehydrogenase (NADP+)/methenyltetrahydrofolate cyclohydrolase
MTAILIDGKAIAKNLREDLKARVDLMAKKPGLAVILVGDDPASHVYVSSKIKACAAVGIQSFEHRLPDNALAAAVASLIETLNEDPDVHGILMQLPLPSHIRDETPRLLELIAPEKDVDGLTTTSAGRLMAGLNGMVPCTPQGAMRLIQSVCPDLAGKHAVVLGRSLLFGKPMQQLLLAADCTVTQVHSRSVDIPSYVRQADIVVAAVGRAEMVRGDWVKDGAIVIDVGINRMDDGTLKGDVAFDEVAAKASAITPVPGGVGPMTIACLLANTVKAASTSTAFLL